MVLLLVSVQARRQQGCKVEKYINNISNQPIHGKYYNKANEVKYDIVSHKHELPNLIQSMGSLRDTTAVYNWW